MDTGSAAEWASAAVGLIAVIAAIIGGRAAWRANQNQLAELAILGQQEADRLETAKMDDASKIATWVRTEKDQPVIRYINTSTKPVYSLTIWVSTPDYSFRIERSVTGPYAEGRDMRTASAQLRDLAADRGYLPDWRSLLANQNLLCASTFRDSAGRWWSRDFTGQLRQADDADLAMERVLHDRCCRFPAAVDAPLPADER